MNPADRPQHPLNPHPEGCLAAQMWELRQAWSELGLAARTALTKVLRGKP